MELFVFDMEFNRIGIIDDYVSTEFDHKYDNHSTVFLSADATKENSDLLLNNDELRVIAKSTDINRGYVIETAEYEDDSQLRITVIARSLSIMTAWRIVEGQQKFSGNVEDVLKSFVNLNAIKPTNPNRVIPNLVLGVNEGVDIIAEEVYSNIDLDRALWEICKKYDMSFEILMNHEAKKYVFSTYMGADRSAAQTINPHVIFAKAFDNVTFQSYVDDKSNYRSTAYIVGEGEESNRTLVKVNDGLFGFNRREIFIEATDLQKVYKNENDVEVTLTQAEYEALLKERGLNRLAEYQRIRTFESDIDLYSQFIFNEHYFLGDKVTTRNDELGIITHSRVVRSRELYNRDGYELKLEFGTSIPTLTDKLKRTVKK